MTKSRSRYSNDNALAESKNRSIVRKCFGYVQYSAKMAPLINEFNRNHLTPYINFHQRAVGVSWSDQYMDPAGIARDKFILLE